jgi:hypothetical protein
MSRLQSIIALLLCVIFAPCELYGAGKVPYGGDIRIVVEDTVQSMDPAQARSGTEILIAAGLHQSLLGIDASGEIEPVLLEALPKSRGDQQRWACKLRGGLFFQDGQTPLTAERVRESFERFTAVGSLSPFGWFSHVVDVEMMPGDPLSFDLVLRIPVHEGVLFRLLSLVHTSIVFEQQTLIEGRMASVFWGLGPFRLQGEGMSEEGHREIYLEGFVGHIHGRPYLDQATLILARTVEEEESLLKYRHAHMGFVEVEGAEDMAAAMNGPVQSTVFLRASNTLGVEPRALRALSAWIDAERLTHFLDSGRPSAASHLWPSGTSLRPDPPERISESLTIGYDARDVGLGLERVVQGVKTLWHNGGSSDIRVNLDGMAEGSDYMLEQVFWFDNDSTLGALRVLGGLSRTQASNEGMTPQTFLAYGYGLNAAASMRLLDRTIVSGRMIPISFLRPIVHFRNGIEGVQFDTRGVLSVGDLWWRPSR